MALREWLKEYPTEDVKVLAERAFTDIPEIVMSIVAEAIEHVRRENVRTVEQHNMRDFLRTFAGPAADRPALDDMAHEAFRLLLSESFALGDRLRVTWGAATIEQHQQRIALLRGMVQGLTQTIDRHELAIKRLQTIGVPCLNALLDLAPTAA